MLAVIPFVLRIKSLNVPLYDDGTIYPLDGCFTEPRGNQLFLVRKNTPTPNHQIV